MARFRASTSQRSETVMNWRKIQHGKHFASSGSLDNKIRDWVIQAGFYRIESTPQGKEKKKATRFQHGLRKAKAMEIAEQGGSVYEVMAYLSHSDPKTSSINTKRVERARLDEQAAYRVEAAKHH